MYKRDKKPPSFSGYAHGLIFNVLYKAVNGPVVNDNITSLAVHLLELSLTFPQNEYSGKVKAWK
jgi:hypothetical protein